MKTAKGNNYQTLLNMTLTDRTLTVHIPLQQNLLGDIDQALIDKAIPFISELIQSEKRGSGVMEKELLRVEYHREQLRDAYLSLWQSYVTQTTPQTRQSSATKAQEAMFAVMNDKLLRQFASGVIGEKADDFVLPDERQRLIDAVIAAMKGSNGNGTTEKGI